jgi:hypothetical protein
LLADNGYFSDANVALCAAAQIDPMIALGRQPRAPFHLARECSLK